MILVLVLLVYAGILVFDFLPRIKKQTRKEIVLYLLFFVPSLIVTYLHEMMVDIPSPAQPIKYLIQTIFHLK